MSKPHTEPNVDETLVGRILEIAFMRNETDEGALVDMPDEEEWGELVGLARKRAKELCDDMEKLLLGAPTPADQPTKESRNQ